MPINNIIDANNAKTEKMYFKYYNCHSFFTYDVACIRLEKNMILLLDFMLTS